MGAIKKFEDLSILSVEDLVDDRELMSRAFKRFGFRGVIHYASDGGAALALLKKMETLPDLLTVDLKMPRVGGLELIQVIKSDPRLSSIPIVIVTSSMEGSDLKGASQWSGIGYICKPTSSDEFPREIQKMKAFWESQGG